MFLPVLMILELELVFMLPELVIFDPAFELLRTRAL